MHDKGGGGFHKSVGAAIATAEEKEKIFAAAHSYMKTGQNDSRY